MAPEDIFVFGLMFTYSEIVTVRDIWQLTLSRSQKCQKQISYTVKKNASN